MSSDRIIIYVESQFECRYRVSWDLVGKSDSPRLKLAWLGSSRDVHQTDEHVTRRNVTRRQFPVRPCATMTVHKSQASIMDRVVVNLRDDVFEHGQLYVAFWFNRLSLQVH